MAAKAPDTDTDAKDDPAGAKGSPKGGLKRKLMIGGVAVAVLGGAVGGYVFFAGKHQDEHAPAIAAAKPPAFFDLPDVLVNLSNTGSERTQYLKVKLVLELPDAGVVAQIQPVMPRVLDAFQVFLRELRPADLEGSAGVFRLKEELTRRVNVAIAPTKINAVLFKEFVVQ